MTSFQFKLFIFEALIRVDIIRAPGATYETWCIIKIKSESKIELYMKYNKGPAVASDCIFKRKHLSNEILIHQAFLVNRSGQLIYLEGIKVKMLDN